MNGQKGFLCVIFIVALISCSNKDNVNDIMESGVIEAREVMVSSIIPGTVTSVKVEEGDEVNVGDTLAIIDQRDLYLQLKLAEANLKMADAQLSLLLKGTRIEDIEQAKKSVQQAKADLENAELDLQRIKTLFEKGSATKKQFDDISARHSIALAKYESAETQLEKLIKGPRSEEIESASAGKQLALANIDVNKKKINDCFIISPINGIVSHKLVESGEMAKTGTGIINIVKMDKVWLKIYIQESKLGNVKIGQKAEIKIDSHPDRVFNGEVTFISQEAEFTPKNIQTKEERVKLVYEVKIEIDNLEGILKPGMPADATLIE
jgi:HlyD family secretion protein